MRMAVVKVGHGKLGQKKDPREAGLLF